MQFKEPQCSKRNCKHFLGIKRPKEHWKISLYRPYCAAFPDGIPEDIAYGDNLHLTPVEGDNGITYEEEDRSELFGDQEE